MCSTQSPVLGAVNVTEPPPDTGDAVAVRPLLGSYHSTGTEPDTAVRSREIVPLGFRKFQSHDLTEWDGGVDGLRSFLFDLSHFLGPPPIRDEDDARRKAQEEQQQAGIQRNS